VCELVCVCEFVRCGVEHARHSHHTADIINKPVIIERFILLFWYVSSFFSLCTAGLFKREDKTSHKGGLKQ